MMAVFFLITDVENILVFPYQQKKNNRDVNRRKYMEYMKSGRKCVIF